MKMILDGKTTDEIWDSIQGIVPKEYLNKWNKGNELDKLHKKLNFIKDDKKMDLFDSLTLLSKNGYNVIIQNYSNINKDMKWVYISE